MKVVPGVVTVVLVALTASGCGSSGETATDSPTVSVTGGASSTPAGGSAALPDDVCTLVSAAEISVAVGATSTTRTGPSGDCEFSQEDPRGLSGSVGLVRDAASNGGLPAYVAGTKGSLTKTSEHQVAGLGKATTIVTGVPTMSSNLMAGGAVDRGSYLVVVTLVQSKGQTDAELSGAAEKLLRLLDGKVG